MRTALAALSFAPVVATEGTIDVSLFAMEPEAR